MTGKGRSMPEPVYIVQHDRIVMGYWTHSKDHCQICTFVINLSWDLEGGAVAMVISSRIHGSLLWLVGIVQSVSWIGDCLWREAETCLRNNLYTSTEGNRLRRYWRDVLTARSRWAVDHSTKMISKSVIAIISQIKSIDPSVNQVVAFCMQIPDPRLSSSNL